MKGDEMNATTTTVGLQSFANDVAEMNNKLIDVLGSTPDKSWDDVFAVLRACERWLEAGSPRDRVPALRERCDAAFQLWGEPAKVVGQIAGRIRRTLANAE